MGPLPLWFCIWGTVFWVLSHISCPLLSQGFPTVPCVGKVVTLQALLSSRNSLSWYGEESYIQSMEPGAKCFAVHSLGWVEVPEEDLVPGKSSIAVNNCIQQLAQTRSRSRSQPPDGAWGEGQNMLMILKKDAMSLVNPLDHSLIHCQPLAVIPTDADPLYLNPWTQIL